MTCAEFQELLPGVLEGGGGAEPAAHLKSCPACSGLVADLEAIVREAPELQEINEPSPRVWNSIEIALRQEGLIRDPQSRPELVRLPRRGWSRLWLAPVAAALVLVAVGVYQRSQQTGQVAQQGAVPAVAVSARMPARASITPADQQLLEAVARHSPAMQATYASTLQSVNDYIADAEESAQADPSDEEAQRSLFDAYEQRATVYEMALDRSLP